MNFDAVKSFSVLIVGDAIFDRYVFVTPLGKSIKEAVISVRHDREETYRGGVWAAARHIEPLCSRVDVLHGKQIITNTRYLEGIYNRKLFTTHELREGEGSQKRNIRDYDLVIVADFGHGTMTDRMIAEVSAEARFLAVNAQTNSTNFGFNLISKYPRADYVVLDELEARLAARDRDSPIKDVIIKLGHKRVVVTLGANGAMGYDGEFYYETARTDKVVDTIGAGDAFLAVSALFARAGVAMKDLVRIGNAAGAAKTAILGHQRAITRAELDGLGA